MRGADGRFYGKPELSTRICQRCGQVYQPTAVAQKYCGRQKTPGTCAFLHIREKMRESYLEFWKGQL